MQVKMRLFVFKNVYNALLQKLSDMLRGSLCFIASSHFLDLVNLHLVVLSSREKDIVVPVNAKDLLGSLSVRQ